MIQLLIISSEDDLSKTIPAKGTLTLESDTGKTKWGNGVLTYGELPYVGAVVKPPIEEPPIEEPPVEEPPVKESNEPNKFIQYDTDHVLSVIDRNAYVEFNSAKPTTLLVPKGDAFYELDIIPILQIGDGELKIEAEEGVTIHSANGYSLTKQYTWAFLLKKGVNEWILRGDTAVGV